MSIGFALPWALLLLPLLAGVALLLRRRRAAALVYSRTGALRRFAGPSASVLAGAPAAARWGALVALVVALAGPRTGTSTVDVETEGISIMLVTDISSSMLAEDFHPQNRLQVAKGTLAEFIRSRPHDRLGMVAFAGEALTQVPLTVDHAVLFRALDQLDIGLLEDGTAIGTAIATAANRLRSAPGESKVMVLMTDGENNRGEIDPLTAARAAAAYGIRVYTVGVGTEGTAPVPVARSLLGGFQYADLPVSIDEPLLRDIAAVTDARYFRATTEAALDSIYQEIDRLETSPAVVRQYMQFTPFHFPFIIAGLLLLLGEWLLRASRWGRVP
jgi:Ca-activated chloride channel homolog